MEMFRGVSVGHTASFLIETSDGNADVLDGSLSVLLSLCLYSVRLETKQLLVRFRCKSRRSEGVV